MNISKISFLAIFFMLAPKLSFAEKVFSFEGQIDLLRNEFNIVLDLDKESSVAATATRISETDYRLIVDIEHLKTPLFDLLSNVESSVEVINSTGPSNKTFVNAALKGKIWSQYSLVDYKPVQELSGSFEIKDQRLQLTELSFGNLNCNGYIDLIKPYKLSMSVGLLNVDMSDFLNFWSTDSEYESSGSVSGEIKATGTLDNLALIGTLESRNGFVQKLNYDIISLNVEGFYPHMRITNSSISKSDGVSFTLDGQFDLSDRKNFKRQIKALTIAPLVSNTESESVWTFKRLNPEESGVMEIKYRLRKGDALGIGTSTSDEADMFGFERTRNF